MFGHCKTSWRGEIFLLFGLFSDPASMAVFMWLFSSTQLGVISTTSKSNAWLFDVLPSQSAFVHSALLHRKFYLFGWCLFQCINRPLEKWLYLKYFALFILSSVKVKFPQILQTFLCYDLDRFYRWCIPGSFPPTHTPNTFCEVNVFWISQVQATSSKTLYGWAYQSVFLHSSILDGSKSFSA